MARNGSGTYTVPNTFVAGTTITASDHNESWSDIGSEITNSVATDGQTTMTGPLKASNGSVSAPSLTFGSDTDTGWYRAGSNNPALAAGGVKVIDASASGVDFPLILSKAGVGVEAFASGTAMLFLQTAAPTGWTKVTSLDNAAIRLVSGTASSGGTADFTTAFGARTIAQSNLPNISPTITITDTHQHGENTGSGGGGGETVFGTNTGVSSQLTTANTSNLTGRTAAGSITASSSSINGGVTQTTMDFAVKYVDAIRATKD